MTKKPTHAKLGVIVTSELRFVRDRRTGKVYTNTALPYSFWKRYLTVFESVTVLARVLEVEHGPVNAACADGPGVRFVDLPHYLGLSEYLSNIAQLRTVIRAALARPAAIILRVPSQIGTLAFSEIKRHRRTFGLEVVGDPWEGFGPEASDHPLRHVFRVWFSYQLKRQCRSAAGVAYVTQSALQRRFPAAPQAFQTHYSSIELDDCAFASGPRSVRERPQSSRIVTVASLEQPYKGIDLLLHAVARLGDRASLTIVGDGRLRPALENLAESLGLLGRVEFTGAVPGGVAVQSLLDGADLFVLPSRTEGLPRALIEAMARSLPCVGTEVGGIPELLDRDSLAAPSASALAERIAWFLDNPILMATASARNLAKAREYSNRQLQPKRNAFYEVLASAQRKNVYREE